MKRMFGHTTWTFDIHEENDLDTNNLQTRNMRNGLQKTLHLCQIHVHECEMVQWTPAYRHVTHTRWQTVSIGTASVRERARQVGNWIPT